MRKNIFDTVLGLKFEPIVKVRFYFPKQIAKNPILVEFMNKNLLFWCFSRTFCLILVIDSDIQ